MGQNKKTDIEALIKENKRLERENRDLQKLTSSKRFKFAEKIATVFNGVFPKDTHRRLALEKTAHVFKQKIVTADEKKFAKKVAKINELSESYQKIIVINGILWNTRLKQRPHHFAEEFRKLGYFVIYLEQDSIIQHLRVAKKGLIIINDLNLIFSLPQNKTRYFMTPNNLPLSYQKIIKIKKHDFKIIYDYLDEFDEDIAGNLSLQLNMWDNLKEINPALSIATATKLFNELKNNLSKNAKIILSKNAVNADHFDYTKNIFSAPQELKNIITHNHKIVGFYGALAPWIDFELLNTVAKKHPEWQFVYIGSDYGHSAHQLKKLPNVHNLGVKKYQELPKYSKFFNCAIIPFKKGEIAKSTSPVKLFEYMAAGLPTVCTRDLQECKGYKYVYVSKNDEEFEKNIAIAIQEHEKKDVREELLKQAQNNTWHERVKDIDKALSK